ncbi:GtrA family protein [Nocardia sp. NPDC059091]|uniref:GtrA family protein n=1 Tax=unclassified Nocardia TaxID=2637762 RepID=UPI00368D3638
MIRLLAADTALWTDDVRVADSTPVECGRSRETVKRSDLAGWAEYWYCAAHSRYFWGLRLHLIATFGGLPIGFAMAGAKADEREVLLGILDADPALTTARPGQTLIADKNYFGAGFETDLADRSLLLLRPAREGETERDWIENVVAHIPNRMLSFLVRNAELLMFLVVGGIAFATTTVLFFGLKWTVLNGMPVTANVVAALLATIVSYVLNREWAFTARGGRQPRHEAALFFVVAGVGMAINQLPSRFRTTFSS